MLHDGSGVSRPSRANTKTSDDMNPNPPPVSSDGGCDDDDDAKVVVSNADDLLFSLILTSSAHCDFVMCTDIFCEPWSPTT